MPPDERPEPQTPMSLRSSEDSQIWKFGAGDQEEAESLGRATAERAKALVEHQEVVLRGIQAKLIADGEHRKLEERALAHLKVKLSPIERRSSCSVPILAPVSAGAGHGAAQKVAQKVMQRQERSIQFEKRRQALLVEEQRGKCRLLQQQESTSARLQEYQKATQSERQRKLFTLQSSRQEQQKVKRNIDLEKARAREASSSKAREKDAMALGKSGSGLVPPKYSPQSTRSTWRSGSATWRSGSAEGDTDDEDRGDIYRHALESHAIYDGTLEHWRKCVSKNDVRTDRIWHKMMYKDTDNTVPGELGKARDARRDRGRRHGSPCDREEMRARRLQQRSGRGSPGKACSTAPPGKTTQALPQLHVDQNPPSTELPAAALAAAPQVTPRWSSVGLPPPEPALSRNASKEQPRRSKDVPDSRRVSKDVPESRRVSKDQPESRRTSKVQFPSDQQADSGGEQPPPAALPAIGYSRSSLRRGNSNASEVSLDRNFSKERATSKNRSGYRRRSTFFSAHAMAAEIELTSIRSTFFQNEHRTSLRASDLKKLWKYASSTNLVMNMTF